MAIPSGKSKEPLFHFLSFSPSHCFSLSNFDLFWCCILNWKIEIATLKIYAIDFFFIRISMRNSVLDVYVYYFSNRWTLNHYIIYYCVCLSMFGGAAAAALDLECIFARFIYLYLCTNKLHLNHIKNKCQLLHLWQWQLITFNVTTRIKFVIFFFKSIQIQ